MGASIMLQRSNCCPTSQQRQQFQQIKDKLNQATTDEQLKQIFAARFQGRSPKINNPQALKEALAKFSS